MCILVNCCTLDHHEYVYYVVYYTNNNTTTTQHTRHPPPVDYDIIDYNSSSRLMYLQVGRLLELPLYQRRRCGLGLPLVLFEVPRARSGARWRHPVTE